MDVHAGTRNVRVRTPWRNGVSAAPCSPFPDNAAYVALWLVCVFVWSVAFVSSRMPLIVDPLACPYLRLLFSQLGAGYAQARGPRIDSLQRLAGRSIPKVENSGIRGVQYAPHSQGDTAVVFMHKAVLRAMGSQYGAFLS